LRLALREEADDSEAPRTDASSRPTAPLTRRSLGAPPLQLSFAFHALRSIYTYIHTNSISPRSDLAHQQVHGRAVGPGAQRAQQRGGAHVLSGQPPRPQRGLQLRRRSQALLRGPARRGRRGGRWWRVRQRSAGGQRAAAWRGRAHGRVRASPLVVRRYAAMSHRDTHVYEKHTLSTAR
jgi:hypothetical protein